MSGLVSPGGAPLMSQGGPEQQMTIDQLEEIKCQCGCPEFEEVVFVRKVPAVLSRTGKEDFAFLKGLRCSHCKIPFNFGNEAIDVPVGEEQGIERIGNTVDVEDL